MKMKLLYSPTFVSECFRDLPTNETRFEKIVGDTGLLDFLELRLGLPGIDEKPINRILAYQKAMDAAKKGSFYEKAFENDSLSIAKEILRWRDHLVMEGFNFDTKYKSPRIQKLAEVEKLLSGFPEGIPERWRRVHELSCGKIFEVDIDVFQDFLLLPKLIRETLERIRVHSTRYDRMSIKKKAPGEHYQPHRRLAE